MAQKKENHLLEDNKNDDDGINKKSQFETINIAKLNNNNKLSVKNLKIISPTNSKQKLIILTPAPLPPTPITPSMSGKPRRSIRNECPRIKKLQSKGNFFSKALHYQIYLPKTRHDIFRRYDDFEWLYKKLMTKYGNLSGIFIPALPKKIKLKKMTKEKISDHCKAMQEFIIDIFKNDNLYNDQSTTFFLNVNQNQNFSKMRKSFITTNVPLSMSTLSTMSTMSNMSNISNDEDEDDEDDVDDDKNDENEDNVNEDDNDNKHSINYDDDEDYYDTDEIGEDYLYHTTNDFPDIATFGNAKLQPL